MDAEVITAELSVCVVNGEELLFKIVKFETLLVQQLSGEGFGSGESSEGGALQEGKEQGRG